MTTTAAAPPQASAKFKQLYDRMMKSYGELVRLAERDEDPFAKKNEAVSKWSVGQQIDHTAISTEFIASMINVALVIPKRNPEGAPKFAGKVVLWTGYIPRGKGQSPPPMHPKNDTVEKLRANLKRIETMLKGFEPKLSAIETNDHRTPHPMLGSFKPSDWIRFIDIHINHHLKIIRDIEK